MCRLLNEKFPPYEAVIPKSNTYALTAPVADLKSALTRMMVIADDKMHPVSLVIETDSLGLTSLHLESKNDHGVTKEQIQVISTEGEANGSIGFSVKYLQDAISRVTTENLVLRLNPALKSAAIIHDDGPQDKTAVLSIVMPRRA
jgi:DNA polymerase-3 subunit beta